jgi:hypothetical protein
MDEFMNVYEGCGYDAACNHVPYAGAAGWADSGSRSKGKVRVLQGQRDDRC